MPSIGFALFLEYIGVVAGITEKMLELDETEFNKLWSESISGLKSPNKLTQKNNESLYLAQEYLRWVETIRKTEKR